MQYTSDVQVGGRIAAVGQRLLESVGKMMMRQALDALDAGARGARLQRGREPVVKPAPFDYYCPRSLDEALGAAGRARAATPSRWPAARA